MNTPLEFIGISSVFALMLAKAASVQEKGGQQWRIHLLEDKLCLGEESFNPGTAGTSLYFSMTATWSSTSSGRIARRLFGILAPSCFHQTADLTVPLCRKTATSCSTIALGTRRGPLGHGNTQDRGW
jgi:hypothetical protein